ncbi:hypothetical protein [Caballeronia sp. SBC2]|uniref:hypothetical protein n=1 Tax=Caballeronia sp. SBC2 TaxID=2705547 RepID=UPI0013EDF9F3|nr:hypothetical protein [Caballeronia sp. SBC2]
MSRILWSKVFAAAASHAPWTDSVPFPTVHLFDGSTHRGQWELRHKFTRVNCLLGVQSIYCRIESSNAARSFAFSGAYDGKISRKRFLIVLNMDEVEQSESSPG